ncbi:MAG TPA: methylenetetrahydrofolate reductase [NAD(P)H] [Rhodospirillaceae bacterium]|nr:methylenetetrahydrofolate reductase [NAD(P)H] [Rhodospirillaceae bacterium]
MSTRPTLSFEFFPPKTPAAAEILMASATDLQRLTPDFVTVTCGAGGSTKAGTFEAAKRLKDELGYTVGAHISYFGTPKVDLLEYAETLWEDGIRHLVALRGDIPDGVNAGDYNHDDYFQFTSDFVEALLATRPFDVSVGAYPEKHPDAPDMAADIRALKLKCGAGSKRAITQFFFGTDIYTGFLEQVQEAGIETPIVPGLLPIADFARAKMFAVKCGASIPSAIEERFLQSSDPQQTAIDLLASQIDDLTNLNVSHLHFYTLNRADLILSAFQKLGKI